MISGVDSGPFCEVGLQGSVWSPAIVGGGFVISVIEAGAQGSSTSSGGDQGSSTSITEMAVSSASLESLMFPVIIFGGGGSTDPSLLNMCVLWGFKAFVNRSANSNSPLI